MTTRRALVTGASRGIGAAVAERLRRAGFEVLAPTRDQLDLASRPSIEAYVAGGLAVDVVVNNGAENTIATLAALDLDDWQRVLDVNLTAALLLLRAAVPHMAGQRWGRVVNISSCYSFLSRERRGAYTASKSALNGLTRTAALEHGRDGILVNAVCPGFVETEMTRQNNSADQIATLAGQTALGRLATAAEIAELVCFLASERNTYITGQAVVIDGGFSIQ